MSQISTIYDAWITLIETALPTYSRIPQGLDLANTASITLIKGYAFITSSGANTERYKSCQKSYTRSFDIVLVQQITALATNYTAMDTIIKNMHEDFDVLFNAVEKSTILNNAAANIGLSKVISDSGLEFVELDKAKYFQIVINVETEYFENLT